MKETLRIALLMTLVTTLLFGLIYPLAVTGLAQLFYSGLNLILARQGFLVRQAAGTDVRLIVRVSNVLMLVFIGFSAQILGLKGNPRVLVLAATGILMLGLSLVS